MKHDARAARPAPAAPAAGFSFPSGAALALVLAAATWIYWPTLAAPFFADDFLFLDQVRSRSLVQALASPDPLSNFFRPVSRQLYFWLIAHASRESPLAFHAVNLGLFAALVALLFVLARRLAGARAAAIAAVLLALGYAADVPVRWAAGSQELLAALGAVGAILLHLSGRRAAAGIALLLGLLSKETVLLTPLVAAIATRETGEPWAASMRRAWPLWVAVAAWAALWLLLPSRHAQQGASIGLDPAGPIAGLFHLAQVALGFEWTKGGFGHPPKTLPPIVPIALGLAAIAVTAPRPPARKNAPADRALTLGWAWALLAAVPVMAAASVWSAYYYLFAMCGVALALGAVLATRPTALVLGVVAALGVGSASARALDEFAVGRTPWTGRSHLNGCYIDRANRQVSRYLTWLRAAHPTLPRSSTLFFGGIKANVAFQTTDGPLVRWAYRDSSLRSYYLNDLTLARARRGPTFVFLAAGDSLQELSRDAELFPRVAFSMMVADRPATARDALMLESLRGPLSPRSQYWLAWPQLALGDTAAAVQSLARAGYTPALGASDQLRAAIETLQTGDTLGATQRARAAVRAHALDAGAHALLADLLLSRNGDDLEGTVEAYAAHTMLPGQAYAWRRWGMVQTHNEKYYEALSSFRRYLALSGENGDADREVQQWVATIKGMLPGGNLAFEGGHE